MKALSCSGRKRLIEGESVDTLSEKRKRYRNSAKPAGSPLPLPANPAPVAVPFFSDPRKPQLRYPKRASTVPMGVQDNPSVSENSSAASVNGAVDANRPAQRNTQLPIAGSRNRASIHVKKMQYTTSQATCTFFRQPSSQIQQVKRESENDSLRQRACSQY
jgi:hypothetical protein